jgi:hypothetical protein
LKLIRNFKTTYKKYMRLIINIFDRLLFTMNKDIFIYLFPYSTKSNLNKNFKNNFSKFYSKISLKLKFLIFFFSLFINILVLIYLPLSFLKKQNPYSLIICKLLLSKNYFINSGFQLLKSHSVILQLSKQ